MLKKLIPHGLAVLLILAVILSGCGGGKSSRTTLNNPAVYVGGYYYDSETGVYTACYWDADGNMHNLGDGSSRSEVLWLSFYNNRLYVVGLYYKEGEEVPCYWLDGVRYDLGDPGYKVLCGFVYNGQVYAGGCFYSNSNLLPCYWKSGQRNVLSQDIAGYVSSIFVDGSGVYAAGRYNDIICYWDNKGGRYDFSSYPTGLVTQVLVDNNCVYISGVTNNDSEAYYWVRESDGTVSANKLDGTGASSIFVSNNQVYIGGWYKDGGNEIACYWDNIGVRHRLANPDSDHAYVSKIYLYNNKVYATGYYKDSGGKYRACYWDDAGKHNLEDGGKESATKCILVL